MSSPPATPVAAGRGVWSESEKLALCMSLINQCGAPKWSEVALPANRTLKAAKHCYAALKKEAEKTQVVTQGDDTIATPPQPKKKNASPRKKKEKGDAVKPAAKSRKRKVVEDEDTVVYKKVKADVTDEDEGEARGNDYVEDPDEFVVEPGLQAEAAVVFG